MAQRGPPPEIAIPGPTFSVAPAAEGPQWEQNMEAQNPKESARSAWPATRAGTLEPGAAHCRMHTVRSMNGALKIEQLETQSFNTRESATGLTNQSVDRIRDAHGR